MKFFNNKSNEISSNLDWILLTNETHVDEIKVISKQKNVLIFKHSTRCIISRTVLKNFENEFNLQDYSFEIYLLDLLNYRSISNKIALDFEVQHQSPQLLVIKNGICIYNASHENILVENLIE